MFGKTYRVHGLHDFAETFYNPKEKNLIVLNPIIWAANYDHSNRKLNDQEMTHDSVIELFLGLVETAYCPHPCPAMFD